MHSISIYLYISLYLMTIHVKMLYRCGQTVGLEYNLIVQPTVQKQRVTDSLSTSWRRVELNKGNTNKWTKFPKLFFFITCKWAKQGRTGSQNRKFHNRINLFISQGQWFQEKRKTVRFFLRVFDKKIGQFYKYVAGIINILWL